MRPFLFLCITLTLAGGLKVRLASASPAQNVSAQTAQTRAQQGTTVPATTKDPQAVSVLSQALNAAGGIAAIQGVTDYTAIGSITVHTGNGNDVQGSVTIIGGPRNQVRADATFSTGTVSWGVSGGIPVSKLENGTVSKPPSGHVASSNFRAFRTPQFANSLAFPYLQLAKVLSSPLYNLSYKGMVQQNGNSVYAVQAQPAFPSSGNTHNRLEIAMTVTFLFDPSTYQLLTVQDFGERNTVRQLSYSGYVMTNGVLSPMSIAEQFGGQSTWNVQLTQLTFNSGLPDSAFVIQ